MYVASDFKVDMKCMFREENSWAIESLGKKISDSYFHLLKPHSVFKTRLTSHQCPKISSHTICSFSLLFISRTFMTPWDHLQAFFPTVLQLFLHYFLLCATHIVITTEYRQVHSQIYVIARAVGDNGWSGWKVGRVSKWRPLMNSRIRSLHSNKMK